MEETAAPTPEKLYFEYQTNVPKGTRIKSFDDWKKNDWVDRPQSPEEMADQPQPSGEQQLANTNRKLNEARAAMAPTEQVTAAYRELCLRILAILNQPWRLSLLK